MLESREGFESPSNLPIHEGNVNPSSLQVGGTVVWRDRPVPRLYHLDALMSVNDLVGSYLN